jgi:sugar-specific transcriptional regulator TrmB
MALGTENENIKPNQEIIESTLSELGLNRYEARVYLALIAEGTATAKTVSNITGIPYGKIYEVIDGLSRKGFVLTLPTKPAKCKAVSPHESLMRTQKQHNERFKKVEKIILSELEPIFKKGDAQKDPNGFFWIFNGRSAMNLKLQELLNNTQKNVKILTTANGLKRLQLMEPAFKSAKSRGVDIIISAPNGRETKLSPYYCRLHHKDEIPGSIFIFDGSESLFIEPIPDDESLHYGRDIGVWIRSKAFTKCIEQIFTAHQNRIND